MVSATILPAAGSMAICPLVKTSLQVVTAWEYGPRAAGAVSVWMVFMMKGSFLRTAGR